MQAMELQPHHRIVTIGSGGCNMLAYLSKAPASHRRRRSQSAPHRAEPPEARRLQASARPCRSRPLPRHAQRALATARPSTRSSRRSSTMRRAPTGTAASLRSPPHHRLRPQYLSRPACSAASSAPPICLPACTASISSEMTKTRSMREQRQFFDEQIAPLFDSPVMRWITSRKSSLFGLGIPPQQYRRTREPSRRSVDCAGAAPAPGKARLPLPAAAKTISPGRPSPAAIRCRDEGQLPTYLQAGSTTRRSATMSSASMSTMQASPSFWPSKPAASRRPLRPARRAGLDDRPTAERSLGARSPARPRAGARVIFRTAAEKSIIEGRLSPAIRDQWDYFEEQSQRA